MAEFSTGRVTRALGEHWGDQFTKSEWIAAVKIIHQFSDWEKWDFDEQSGMFVFRNKQIAFRHLSKNAPMCESTAHDACTSLVQNKDRPFYLEAIQKPDANGNVKAIQTGRGGLFNIYCAPSPVSDDPRPEADPETKNPRAGVGYSESRSRMNREQVSDDPRQIKLSKDSNPSQLREAGGNQSRFAPDDPETMDYLPFAKIDGWAQCGSEYHAHPDCEQTLIWLFNAFNSYFGLGPLQKRKRDRLLSDSECEQILRLWKQSGRMDEPEFVQECVREFDDARYTDRHWKSVFHMLQHKIKPKREYQ